MQAKTHEVTGISLAVATAAVICEPGMSVFSYGATLVAGAAVGSLLPDIDHGGSKISREHKVISSIVSDKLKHRGFTHSLLANLLVALVCFTISIAFTQIYNGNLFGKLVVSSMMAFIVFVLYDRVQLIQKAINSILPHGKLVVGAVVFGVAYFSANLFVDYANYLSLGIVLGYLSHLIADAFTVSGVAFFQPFSDKVFHFGHFHTGKNENIFRAICMAASLLVVIWRCV